MMCDQQFMLRYSYVHEFNEREILHFQLISKSYFPLTLIIKLCIESSIKLLCTKKNSKLMVIIIHSMIVINTCTFSLNLIERVIMLGRWVGRAR